MGIPETRNRREEARLLEGIGDIDSCLRRVSTETGAEAYLFWVIGMLVGGGISLLIHIFFKSPAEGALHAALWTIITLLIFTKITQAARASMTLSLARMPPEHRSKLELLFKNIEKRTLLGWIVSFILAIALIYFIHALTPLFGIPPGIQLAVGLGNLLMSISGLDGSREQRATGGAMLLTLPSTLVCEYFLPLSGFVIFSSVALLSYLWAWGSLRRRLKMKGCDG